MAKPAKAKAKPGANPRSRAAKRAASPSVDKSLQSLPRATDATPILAARPNGGVHKATKKKSKPLKRGQRARQERGLARAETVMAQMEKKQEGFQARQKKVRGRRALWEEINGGVEEEVRKMPRLLVGEEGREGEGAGEGREGDEQGEWVDDEQGDAEMKVVDGVVLPASAALTNLVVVDRTASSAGGSDLEDIT